MAKIGTLSEKTEAPEQENSQGVFTSALSRANRLGQAATTGAANLLGMPVDMANSALERVGLGQYKQIGSSEDLLELGSKLGMTFKPGEEAEGLSERIAYELGSVSLPTAAILRLGRPALSATQSIAKGAQEATRTIGPLTQTARMAARKPASTTALEVTSATGAAAGATFANQVAPDSEGLEVAGYLLGGFAPSFLQNFSVVGQFVSRGASFVASPLTGERGRQRAARRLQERVADPEAAAAEIDRQAGRGLTPARATGERNLIELESRVRQRYPEVDKQISEQLESAVDDLVKESRSIGSISGQDRVQEILKNRRDYLLKSLDVESAKAGEAYAVRLSQLGQDANPRQIQAAFDETVGSAYDAARATERQLWNNVDTQGVADLQNTNTFYTGEIAKRSKAADPEDIPNFVEDLLNVDEAPTVNYLQDFRSRVLQNIRAERAKDAPNRNKIRFLSGLQENLLEDMQGAFGQSDVLDSAISYSRQLNTKFMQGRVGKLLGFERTGASAVNPQDSIDFILTGGTPTTNVEKVLDAVPQARDNISDFLKNQYAVTSVKPDGKIDKARSNAFFRKYRSVLNSIPGLEQELRNAATSGARFEELLKRKQTVNKLVRDPKRATLSLFLDKPVKDAMQDVLSSKNPSKEAAKIRRKVSSDTEAVEGLKCAYVESIFEKAKTGKLDEETGEAIVSGPKIINQVSSTESAAKSLGLTSEDIERMKSIGQAISRANRRGTPSVSLDERGQIVGDVQNYFLDSVAAFAGARAGGAIGGGNTGASIQAASRGSTALQKVFRFLTKDKAEEILVDAHTDKQLYRELLLTPRASKQRKDKLAKTLGAYLPSSVNIFDDEQAQQSEETGKVGPIRIKITKDSSDYQEQR